MEETDAPGTDDGAEEPTETRTVQQLIDGGYAGHVCGSDGGAMIDVHPPRSPEEAERWKWQEWPLTDEQRR
jgi:hypothetical protein